MTYKDHDLYTIWNKYKDGFLTKVEAERSIHIYNGYDKYGHPSNKIKNRYVLYMNTKCHIQINLLI